MKRLARTAVLASGAALVPALANAQALPTSPFHLGTGATYEAYTFADAAQVGVESLSLLAAPFGARARLLGANLTVSGYFAEGILSRPDGSTTTISGLTDTYVQLDVPVAREAVVISAIVAVPTGKATLSVPEAETAGAFAADLLPFRVTNWGTGGALGLATSFARSFGDTGVGLSIGYSVAQEFEPLSVDERAYQPGNELRVRAALDRTIGRAGKASLQLTAYQYQEDVLGGQNLYQSGNRYSAVGSYAFAAGAASSGVLYAGALHRTEGTFFDGAPDAPAQDLLLAGGGVRMPLGSMVLVPSVDGRLFRSEDGLGQGYVTGVGASLEFPLGGMTLVPSARGRFGSVIAREDAESGFTGVDAGVVVRFGGAR